ncbi:hypothetical protein EDF56_1069 [Novosphingobium sp. PhB165]|uniref:hypothetical protein n=1 Tax=Novosphingobium sp. PhB165 TaxID=2485105 RepID=UPI0010445E0E|nr:hypothetical protein [Novosphingobium sp. PhB165]TCM16897.1 hypothetical protein EDF56_1069 [Novosphingobium sp. PhB165]
MIMDLETDLAFADFFAAQRDGNPYWNESVWFSLSVPSRHIHGLIQYYFRPNMGMLNGGPVLWDPSGRFQWNCLHYDWAHLQAAPSEAAKFDMTARNSLSCRMIEPLAKYKLDYDKDGLFLDLTWTAIGPVHQLKTGDAGQSATAGFHIEQPGRMTGTLRCGAEEFAVDCLSMRDCSYGKRDYESLACGGYFWGIAEDRAFHAIAMGEGTEGRSIGGFIWKDGRLSSLVSGRREVLEWGEHGPARALFEATDGLGRTLRAHAEIDPGLIFTGYTDHTVVWSLTRWDWDGVELWGDNQEFCPAARFRAIARGEIAPGDPA